MLNLKNSPSIKVTLFFLFFANTKMFSQWNTIYTSTVSSVSNPFQICYTTDSAIFITTKKEFIYSKNNGTSFTNTNSFVTTPTVTIYDNYREFSDISFADQDTGSIGGYSSPNIDFPFAQTSTGTFNIWKLNHSITPTSPQTKINSIKHFKNQKVYAFDSGSNLYFSSDGGNSWILKKTINSTSPIWGFTMCMVDEQIGYFSTLQGLYKTTDAGQTISHLPGFPSSYLSNIKKIRFRDAQHGYIIGVNATGENKLFKTADGGNTWQSVFQGKLPDPLVDVNFPTNDTGFVATGSYILQTFNGGAEWYIQRFTNTGFTEIDFFDKNHGTAVALTGANSLKILKYVPNTISNSPFATFSFQTNYCCNGQVCNIINYGSPSWSYKWYVNNVLLSTAFTPTGLILPNVGSNSIKLVTANGTNKDSVTLTVYNADIFLGNSNYSITPYDSTICLGTQANLLISNYSSQLSYSAFSNSVQISPWQNQSSGNLVLNTSGLTFSDTIITVKAVTSYSGCPGNSFSKDKKIKILSLPPSNLMTLVSDSICYGDSAKMIISPCTNGTNYKIWCLGNGSVFDNFTAPTGSSHFFGWNIINSQRFYYTATDTNNCSTTSPPLLVKVDSMWTKLFTVVPAVKPGDTLLIDNSQSVATNFNWTFSPGTTVINNNDTIVKLKYTYVGDYYLTLRANNKTGCRDSIINYNIGVYNDLNQGSGETVCFSDTTLLDNLKQQPAYSWFIQSNGYHRFHTDLKENYYLIHNKYLSANGWGTSLNYGAMHFRIMKYDKNGNLKWTLTPNFATASIGPGFNYVYSTIATVSSDINGNIYITGNFRGNKLTIGNISRTFTTTSNSGYSNSFVAKIDSSGDCKWILAMNKVNNTSFQPVSVGKLVADQGNSIYMKADFVGTAVFTNTVVNIGGYQSCLFVIDTAGNLIRMQLLYETDEGQGSISSTDASGSSSYADYFSYADKILKYKDKLIFYAYSNKSSIQLFNGPTLSASILPGYTKPALVSYVIVTDTLGNLLSYFKPAVLYDSLWLGSGNSYSYTRNYEPNLSIDKNGNVYFLWNIGHDIYYNWSQYNNTAFNKGKYNSFNLMVKLNDNSEIKKTDLFSMIAKYDLNGTLLWHKEANYVFTKSLVANNDGNIYGLAQFDKLAAFESSDNNNQMTTTTDTCNHILLYSYDNAGNFLWGKQFMQGGNGVQYPGELIKKDSCNNNLYFSAGFDTTITFAGNIYPKVTKTYIFEFSPDGSCSEINCTPTIPASTNIKTHEISSKVFSVVPNPNNGQFSIRSNSNEELFIQIYNNTGQLISETKLQPYEQHVLFNLVNSGIYYVVAKGETTNGKQKILIIH